MGAIITDTRNPQALAMLRVAEEVRLGRHRLRLEVGGGWALASDLIAEPNDYPSLKRCPVYRVLGWQERWGPATSRRFLHKLGLTETVMVGPIQPGGLTMRQRIEVVEALRAVNR